MNIRNSFSKLLVLAALMALVAVFGVRSERAQAFEDPNEKPSPMVGLARGQTARLNVVNLFPPDPCDVQIVFYDSQGKPLARGADTLKPGAAMFLDLSYSAIGDPNSRVEIRAQVTVSDPKRCRASLEVFDDDTGRTAVFVGDTSISQ
jgi:hypothetical protein